MSQRYRKHQITTTFKQETCRNLIFSLRLRQVPCIWGGPNESENPQEWHFPVVTHVGKRNVSFPSNWGLNSSTRSITAEWYCRNPFRCRPSRYRHCQGLQYWEKKSLIEGQFQSKTSLIEGYFRLKRPSLRDLSSDMGLGHALSSAYGKYRHIAGSHFPIRSFSLEFPATMGMEKRWAYGSLSTSAKVLEYSRGSTRVLSGQYSSTSIGVLEYSYWSTRVFLLKYSDALPSSPPTPLFFSTKDGRWFHPKDSTVRDSSR